MWHCSDKAENIPWLLCQHDGQYLNVNNGNRNLEYNGSQIVTKLKTNSSNCLPYSLTNQRRQNF